MQSKNKNDGIQFSERYWGYMFAKRYLGGEGCGKVFPIGEGGEIHNRSRDEGISKSITATCYKGVGNDGTTLIKSTQKLPDAQRIREIDGCATTLKGEGGGQGAKTGLYAIPTLTPDRAEKRQNGRRFKENGDPMFTLTGQDIHGIFNGARIRRLTPTECEALQGFPQDWTKYGILNGKTVEISDSQRYKCLGNAVTTNVIQMIVERLYQ